MKTITEPAEQTDWLAAARAEIVEPESRQSIATLVDTGHWMVWLKRQEL